MHADPELRDRDRGNAKVGEVSGKICGRLDRFEAEDEVVCVSHVCAGRKLHRANVHVVRRARRCRKAKQNKAKRKRRNKRERTQSGVIPSCLPCVTCTAAQPATSHKRSHTNACKQGPSKPLRGLLTHGKVGPGGGFALTMSLRGSETGGMHRAETCNSHVPYTGYTGDSQHHGLSLLQSSTLY